MEDQAASAAAAVAARLVSENQDAYAGEPGTTDPPPEAPTQDAEQAGKRKFEGGFEDGLDGSDPSDGTRKRTGSSGAGEVRWLLCSDAEHQQHWKSLLLAG